MNATDMPTETDPTPRRRRANRPSIRQVAVIGALAILGMAVGAGATAVIDTSGKPGLRVVELGYSRLIPPHDRTELSWAAVLGNPRDNAAVKTELEFDVVNARGRVIEDHDRAFIGVVLPGRTVGVAGTVDLPGAARIRITSVRTRSWRPAHDVATVKVNDVVVAQTHENHPIVGYRVRRGPDEEFPRSASAYVLYRDGRGQLIGGTGAVLPRPKSAHDTVITDHVLADAPVPHLARAEVYVDPDNG